jgi:hypothetical protein
MPVQRSETGVSADFGMALVDRFQQRNGRRLPLDDEEFAGMLAIAFMLGRESIADRVRQALPGGQS